MFFTFQNKTKILYNNQSSAVTESSILLKTKSKYLINRSKIYLIWGAGEHILK